MVRHKRLVELSRTTWQLLIHADVGHPLEARKRGCTHQSARHISPPTAATRTRKCSLLCLTSFPKDQGHNVAAVFLGPCKKSLSARGLRRIVIAVTGSLPTHFSHANHPAYHLLCAKQGFGVMPQLQSRYDAQNADTTSPRVQKFLDESTSSQMTPRRCGMLRG